LNDITVYARSALDNESVSIEIYLNDSDELISVIENISIENWYKTYLTGMNGSHAVFDLKIVSGFVNGSGIEFDLIIDPTEDDINLTSPSPFSGDLVFDDILINLSFSNADNATIFLFNSTMNLINITTSSSSPLFLNYSNLSSGVYFFNASVDDSSGGFNYTLTRNLLLINPNLTGDGSVINSYKINESRFGDGNQLNSFGFAIGDNFGSSIANIGDLDGDGIQDIAVGEYQGDDGCSNVCLNGQLWILFLNSSGGVKSESKINITNLGNGNELINGSFGISVANLGDLDGDGVQDLVVGEFGSLDGGAFNGAVWILFLNTSGGVKSEYKINESRFGNGNELGG